ncbi:protein FAR1-RELATED SEQUENCE 5-like [Beta vulgaris subsp. vulgaris]|uniref:protein FAR1-RELATED SEQUENCE 5-like n=1 Tax=Beta vulgaris subsp. vulgaris TaxID=3555 RepID=UPI0025493B78|nr:protein FAR1-RELATED SEQUENCE 5-like [Beta vulgaris subsp. vulgaris]
MLESGLRPAQAYNLMSHEAGGIQSVGHTLTDHLNYISRKKMKEIEGGDAQNVIDNLYQRQQKDQDHFFRFKLGGGDKGNKLTAIFWRDSQMMEDYKIYGDVIVFDTTFRTNKYNLICAPIVGINNHWQNVMFGCAFIANETQETFEWVLNTFKKSMGGLDPISIFTDQDLAMSKAIQKVLPNTRHRLCIWHLIKNAVSRFGALKKDPEFKKVFNKCLRGCITPEEFEQCWEKMIKDYKLKQSKWFNRLYKLKNKWCTALSKDFFSAGILSSQRSESTNNAVGFKARKSTSLTDFFKIFDNTIQRWRKNEANADFRCANSKPSSNLPMCGILKHASEIYTQTLFREIETEFSHGLKCLTKCIDEVGSAFMYEVWIEENEKSKQLVSFDMTNNTIECSCKNFQEVGWLCYHCFRVFFIHSVNRIPDKYIYKRWTKLAKAEYWKRREETTTKSEAQQQKYMPWRTVMARKSYNLILKSQAYQETRRLLEVKYNDIAKEIEQVILNKISEEAQEPQQTIDNEEHQMNIPVVEDPERANTKGRSKRIKGFFEKGKQPKQKKTKAMTVQGEGIEYGTITPIQKPTLF